MDMLPPSEVEEFYSSKKFEAAMQAHAYAQGYAVTAKRSSAQDSTVDLRCDRGGTYQYRNSLNEGNCIRDMNSCLVGCPFVVKGKLKSGVWAVKVQNGDHNYGPLPPIAHSIQCGALLELNNKVERLSAAGMPAYQVIRVLYLSTTYPFTSSNIHNIKQRMKMKNLTGKSPIEVLIDVLCASGTNFEYKTDRIGRVTHLFWADSSSIELLNYYPEVLLFDCTYRTNKFKLALLNIVGTTCLNMSFHVMFCFMAKENKASFTWVLQRLRGLL
jgi:hypothetical protein